MKPKELAVIGITEMLSLPDDGIKDVPAKVDTGADGSSIWASNIRQKSGKLTFCFFGPGSVFYTGKSVTSTAFKVVRVKNSFGYTEFRYKISLKIKLGSHSITRWFSLADRSRNTHPVLIGKNILKNRFVVDVSQKFLISENVPDEVFILCEKYEEMQEFLNQAETPTKYHCANYDTLLFNIGPDSISVTGAETAKDIAQYALTYFKTHDKNSEMAAALAEYLKYKARPFIDQEIGGYVSASKLSQYMKLASHNLPIPATFCAKTVLLSKKFQEIQDSFGLPFVVKDVFSDRGQNNFMITAEKEFNHILQNAMTTQLFVVQKYIPNDGFLRVYVLGRQVALIIGRRHTKPNKNALKSHLNKPFGGDNAYLMEPDELPGEVQEICIRAAETMNRQIAGVDIVRDKVTNKWYILEVNNAPQLRSGTFIPEKLSAITKYFDKEMNR